MDAATMMLQLDVLPACHGDCLVVTYGSPKSPHRILIDGGPANSYDTGLGAYLAALPAKQRHFDLLIVSHIDTDHIEGAICMLNDAQLGMTFGDVWFNRWEELAADSRGALQGEYFTELLRDHRVNAAFHGKAITRNFDRYVAMPGGARITIISPSSADLGALRREWVATCAAAGFAPGSSKQVAERLAKRAIYRPEQRAAATVARGATAERFGSDTTAPNGSSIGIIFEYRGRRLLLTGDAHASTMIESFRELNARWGTRRIHLDLCKLAHHGSVANITADLLDQIDCDEFVVSTNGDHFHHPDRATLLLIGESAATRRPKGDRPLVHFNYAERAPSAREVAAMNIRANTGTAGRLTLEWPIR